MRRFGMLAVFLAAALSAPAQAIPSFARKYGTSCMTCHTVYPKLAPFGEAFRRNSFRFPGTDSDYVKQEVIPLTPKAAGSDDQYGINAIAPLSLGFNGFAVAHPDKSSTGGRNDQGAVFLSKNLVAEAHLWAGGSFSAQVYASDLIGPKHFVNVRVGRGFSTLTSFGPHSSYILDQIMPPRA